MPRVKGGVTAHRRHKKVLAVTKGQRGTRHSLYRRANESMLHSLHYQTRDRRVRKRDMRRLWITRINAAARLNGMTYSRFIQGLHLAGVDVNRKMMAEMAVNDPEGFAQLVEVARSAIAVEA